MVAPMFSSVQSTWPISLRSGVPSSNVRMVLRSTRRCGMAAVWGGTRSTSVSLKLAAARKSNWPKDSPRSRYRATTSTPLVVVSVPFTKKRRR
jgi:hypothetical protein